MDVIGKRHRPGRAPRGFTLIELVVAVAIIVLLATVAVPMVEYKEPFLARVWVSLWFWPGPVPASSVWPV